MKPNQQNCHTIWQKKSEIKGFQVLCLDCRTILDNLRYQNNSNNPSNIVQHLVQSKHSKIQIIIDSSERVQNHIICSSCKQGDAFKLEIYDYPQGILLLCNDCSLKFINITKTKIPHQVKHSNVIESKTINQILFDTQRVYLNPDSLKVNQQKKSKVQYIKKVQVEEANTQPQNICQAQHQSTNNSNQNLQIIGSDKIQQKNQSTSEEKKIDKFQKIQCLDCKQHFDNQKMNGSLKSNIIKHLSKLNHNRVKFILNQDQQENIIPDCYKCQKRNIFDLTICKVNNEEYLFCSKCFNNNNGSIFTNDLNIARKQISSFPNEPFITNNSINSTYLDQIYKSAQPKNIQPNQIQLSQHVQPQSIQISTNNKNQSVINDNLDTSVKCLQCNNIFENQRNKHDSITQIIKHLKKCSHNMIEIQQNAKKTSLTKFNCLSCNQNNIFILFILEAESFYFVLCKQCISNKLIKFQGNDPQSIEKYKKSAIVLNGAINTLLMNLNIKKKEYQPKIQVQKNQPDQHQIEQDIDEDDYDFCLNQHGGADDEKLKSREQSNPNSQSENNQPHSHQQSQGSPIESNNNRNNDQEYEYVQSPNSQKIKNHIERFESVVTYQSFFKKMVQQEQNEIIKQIQQNNFTTSVLITSENKIEIDYISSNHLLKEGKEFEIKFNNFKSKLYVKSVQNGKIIAKIQNSSKSFKQFKINSVIENVQIKLKHPKQIFERIMMGIKQFSNLEKQLQDKILGQFKQDDSNIKSDDSLEIIVEQAEYNSGQLNQNQLTAIQASLQKNISLIQGPPGTGKTETAAHLVLDIWDKVNKKLKSKKILVCAPSNLAADNIADRIHAKNNQIKVLRIVSQARQRVKVSYKFEEIVLHKILKNLKSKNKSSDFKKAQQLIEEANVVCTTCINSVDRFLEGFAFSTVIIDESNQAIEPETLIPLYHQAINLILIGDHKQLPPIIQSPQASKEGLKRSLYSRLVQAGLSPQFLSIQYRMHPEIRKLASSIFYENQLKDGINEEDRIPTPKFNWLNKKIPIQFYDIQGQEITLQDGKSYVNEEEAKIVKDLVSQLLKAGVKDQDIGIITPYLSQSNYISQLVQKQNILIDTTYSFQGQEKDYIIISCVRINNFQNLGILRIPQLINVSITRAKRGLLIVGNKEHVSHSRWWKKIIEYLEKQQLIQEIKKDPVENINCIDNNSIINKIDERISFVSKKH
ncbi:hypothetical protein ABPG74_003558 [Tetrahymena malaccensis]